MYHLLKVSPSDLRGIGIQITRLEDMKDSKNPSLTKYLVPKCDINKKLQTFSSGNSSKMNSAEECGVYDINRLKPEVSSTMSIKKNTKMLSTTLDETVLCELPEHIRLEVLADYDLISKKEQRVQESNLSEESLSITLSQVTFLFIFVYVASIDIKVFHTDYYFQVDPSFLAALPEDVCNDLKNDLTDHKSKRQMNFLQEKNLKTKGGSMHYV